MAHGGRSVARHEGRVVFVADAYPHEVVEVEVTESKKRHSFARDSIHSRAFILTDVRRRVRTSVPAEDANGSRPNTGHKRSGSARSWPTSCGSSGKLDAVDVRPTISPGPEFGYRNRMDFSIVGGRPALHREESSRVG